MSAKGPKGDIGIRSGHVRFTPNPDIDQLDLCPSFIKPVELELSG
jgi:hypothetical protein